MINKLINLKNEDIKLDNEYFNTFYIGSSVMLNNYNSQVSKTAKINQNS